MAFLNKRMFNRNFRDAGFLMWLLYGSLFVAGIALMPLSVYFGAIFIGDFLTCMVSALACLVAGVMLIDFALTKIFVPAQKERLEGLLIISGGVIFLIGAVGFEINDIVFLISHPNSMFGIFLLVNVLLICWALSIFMRVVEQGLKKFDKAMDLEGRHNRSHAAPQRGEPLRNEMSDEKNPQPFPGVGVKRRLPETIEDSDNQALPVRRRLEVTKTEAETVEGSQAPFQAHG